MTKKGTGEESTFHQVIEATQLLARLCDIFSASPSEPAETAFQSGIKLFSAFASHQASFLSLADGHIFSTNAHATSQRALSDLPFSYHELEQSPEKIIRNAEYTALYRGAFCEGELVGIFILESKDCNYSFLEHEKITVHIASEIFASAIKRTRQALSNQELDLRFRSVLDNLQEGVSIGDLDDRILYVNHRYSQMLEYTPEELIGRRGYRFLVPQEEQNKILEATSRRCSGHTDSYECTQITKSGKRIVTVISASPYRNVEGRVIGNIASHADITVRRNTEIENERLQKQLNRGQKMEAVGQLAAGFAHDLNNSLTAVMGHLNFAKLQPNLEQATIDSLNAALQGCRGAGELIRKVLTFSSDVPVQAKRDDLRSVVDEAIDLTKALIPKNTSVRISGQHQDYPVYIDRALVVQVLTNLLINASQAMENGGTISFSFSSTDFESVHHLNRAAAPGRYWVLTVSDTGVGIPEGVQSRIFEPFFSTKGDRNSGLGLSMVYGAMQRHKGWIEVDSTEGAGTAFSLYFPDPTSERLIKMVEAEHVPPSTPVPMEASAGTIVVVDDEPVLAELACSFLERAGFKTISFSNPLEVFEWYKEHHAEVSLILLDMKMPGCDGVEAFERLKVINPGAQIVLISGYVDNENVSKLLNRGAVSFIQKPVKYSELVEWVKKTVRASHVSHTVDPLFH